LVNILQIAEKSSSCNIDISNVIKNKINFVLDDNDNDDDNDNWNGELSPSDSIQALVSPGSTISISSLKKKLASQI